MLGVFGGLLLVALVWCGGVGGDMICNPSFCSDQQMKSTPIKQFCGDNALTIKSLCCVNVTAQLIYGVDYSACNLKNIETALSIIPIATRKAVRILDLNDNPFSEYGFDTFAGFLRLDNLYLPNNTECPGRNYSWATMRDDNEYLQCSGQKRLCRANSTYVNSNCTDQSYCVDNGPDSILCNCKPGFHGYKCLNQDTFPDLAFTLGMCIGTVMLSGLLWHTQRRHVVVKKAT